MPPDTDLFARKIAGCLDDAVSPAVAARLAASRRLAVSAMPRSRFDRSGLAVRMGVAWLQLRYWLLAGLVLLGVAASHVYQTGQALDALAEGDAQLLADELPIEAYQDTDFAEFLRQPSHADAQ